jgi:hypothetical protein
VTKPKKETLKRARITGKQIAGLRARMYLNVQEFAGALGVHASSVYRWEATARPALRPSMQAIIERLLKLDDDHLKLAGEAIKLALAAEQTDQLQVMQRTLAAVA